MKTAFINLLEAADPEAKLRLHISDIARGVWPEAVNTLDPRSFGIIPRSPFCYWASSAQVSAFERCPAFESSRDVKQGLAATDDMRFVRCAWEHPLDGNRWFPFYKGGTYSPFYADPHLSVDWFREGAQSWAVYEARRHITGGIVKNPEFYFRPGLTWPRRTSSELSMRLMPAGCIFADKGPSVFLDGSAGDRNYLALVGLVNSHVFRQLVGLQLAAADAAARSYEVGVIRRTPVPIFNSEQESHLAAHALTVWSCLRSLDESTMNSHTFVLPGLLRTPGGSIALRTEAWGAKVGQTKIEVDSIQSKVDDFVASLYEIEEPVQPRTGGTTEVTETEASDQSSVHDLFCGSVETESLVHQLLEWCVGVAIGRFDLRLASGEREWPEEPEPFDPLPVCSPGMLQDANGLPATDPPSGYPIDFSITGLLVDDPGHRADLRRRMESVFDHLGPKHPKTLWDEAQEQLGRGGLERWLRKDCFGEHLARYSKSRRQAPIFWQLGTPSAEYSVWLYYHRANKDTLYKVLNDYVKPKLSHEQTRLDTLAQEGGQTPSPAQRRGIEKQERRVEEFRAMRDDVERVAPLWAPNLDDGVIINAAPLWRLFSHTKKWQKACYDCWEKLVDGDYDWSHIAMHLWPERVVPKCADDRSLAIAHGLEEVFWSEDLDGKWLKREVSKDAVKRLIEERSSDAVTAAREILVSLPGPNTKGRRGARR